ncbi:HD domain-containing phosphohydrolase [Petrotoga sp. 9PW.55.5.1]|uniref:HD domain-containing phosphohydrolase n=1 Tax=Petrotoga sp. 9PW.55.5.1 TaxID=1308979 RepID=UPI001314AA44|nr:HD domain-containing phosphohydrolase [Petrotoga sp. 9PW.55.5.1]
MVKKYILVTLMLIMFLNAFSNILNVIFGDYYPDIYIDNEGIISGFAVDILKEVEKNSNLTFNITIMNWDEAYETFLNTDDYDLIGLIIPTKERKEIFNFFDSVISSTPFIMTLYDNNKTYNELKNYEIGILKNSFLKGVLENEGFNNIIEYSTTDEIIKDLLDKKIESAAIEDERVIQRYLILNDLKPNIKYMKIFDPQPLTFASKINSKNEALKEFDRTLKTVLKSSDFELIQNLWMGIDTSYILERQKQANRLLIFSIVILSGFFIALIFFNIRSRTMVKNIKLTNKELENSFEKISILSDENKELSEKLEKIHSIFYSFIESNDTKSILNNSLEGLINLLPEAEAGSIGLVSDHTWKIYAAHGFPKDIYNAYLPIEEVIKVGKHVKEINNLNDYNQNIPKETENIFSKIESSQIKSSLFIDLYNGELFLGNISVNSKKALTFSESSKKIMEIFGRLIEIFIDLKFKEREAIDAYNYSLQKLSNVAENFDSETNIHMERICDISYEIAKKLDLKEETCQEIKRYAYYHDIGKILIPIEILKKPRELTPTEFLIIKKHTEYGAEIIGDAEIFKVAKNIALYHHERWDGTGYPFGLKGEDIPIEARIVAIADVYDALRSRRPYKKSFTHEQSMKIITVGDERTSPTHFDPKVLDIFKKIIENFKKRY